MVTYRELAKAINELTEQQKDMTATLMDTESKIPFDINGLFMMDQSNCTIDYGVPFITFEGIDALFDEEELGDLDLEEWDEIENPALYMP